MWNDNASAISGPRTTPAGPSKQHMRRVALVSRDSNPVPLLNALADAADCSIFVLTPINLAYSRIRQSAPDMIVARFASDDVEGCLLLSMLQADRATAGIPIALCLSDQCSPPQRGSSELPASFDSCHQPVSC